MVLEDYRMYPLELLIAVLQKHHLVNYVRFDSLLLQPIFFIKRFKVTRY